MTNKLERDILSWEYNNETKDMYSPPSPIQWLEDKLIELREHNLAWRSEELKAFISVMIEEFDSGGVSWETRDTAESLLKDIATIK